MDDHIKNKGPLWTGDAITTTSGDLNCKHLIHSVGPTRGMYDVAEEANGQLNNTVRNLLRHADKLGDVESISMPVFCTGPAGMYVNGFKKEEAVEIILTTCVKWLQYHGPTNTKLKTIRICDVDAKTCTMCEE